MEDIHLIFIRDIKLGTRLKPKALYMSSVYYLLETKMAVIKFTKSKQALQFIADDGVMYQWPVNGMRKYLDGTLNIPFLVPSKLPLKVSLDRFKQSPVYDPAGLAEKLGNKDNLAQTEDALSSKTIKKAKQVENYSDKEIDW